MPDKNEPTRVMFHVGLIILVRVVLILLIWLVLFLGMFLGYFTVPIILIGALTLVYTLTDAGLYLTVRRQTRQAQDARSTPREGPSHRTE